MQGIRERRDNGMTGKMNMRKGLVTEIRAGDFLFTNGYV